MQRSRTEKGEKQVCLKTSSFIYVTALWSSGVADTMVMCTFFVRFTKHFTKYLSTENVHMYKKWKVITLQFKVSVRSCEN